MLSFYLDEEAFDKEGPRPSSGSEPQKKEALTQSDSEEEDEMQPLEHKKTFCSEPSSL
jgi:hypothetical protein